MALVLTLGMNIEAAAQKHRHHPQTEVVDATQARDSTQAKDATQANNAVEAYSDTTTAGADVSSDVDDAGYYGSDEYEDRSGEDVVKEVFRNLDSEAIGGMFFVLMVVLILFVIAPIGIIIAVFYFINRNRREKFRLAQMAMQNGQPIPNELLQDTKDDWDSTSYQAGIRQMFVGVGLAIFLGIVAGKIGFGIGALVFFIGLGKWFVARKPGSNGNGTYGPSSNNSNHPEV